MARLSPQSRASGLESEGAQASAQDDRQFVVAIARGMAILRAFRRDERYLSNQELAQRSGLPKPTVSRLTYTLVRLGCLTYVPSRNKYMLGPGVLSLGHAYLASLPVRELARPLMQRLAEHAQAAVSLGTLDHNNMVVLEICQDGASDQAELVVGSRVPHNSTALGRAYFAGLDAPGRVAFAERALKGLNPRERDATQAGIERALRDFEQRGFVCSFGDWNPEVFAVGVPLVLDDGARVLALNCSGPIGRMTHERLLTDIGPRLVALRDQILRSAALP